MIKLQQISKKYKQQEGTITALDNATLSFPNTGFFSIVGESGSGKSTLLNIIGSLITPDKGSLIFNNINMNDLTDDEKSDFRNKNISFIFQENNLIENYTVEENIEIPKLLNGKECSKEEIKIVLDELGISGYENRKVFNLSGGEKQRVAVARAIINKSKVIIADEPTGSLDDKNSENVFEILKKLSSNMLVIVASHDNKNTEKYSNGIIKLRKGQIINDYEIKSYENSSNIVNENIEKNKIPFSWLFKIQKLLFKGYFKKEMLLNLLCVISGLLCLASFSFLFINTKKIIKKEFENTNQYEFIQVRNIDVIENEGEVFFQQTDIDEDNIKILKDDSIDILGASNRKNNFISNIYFKNSRIDFSGTELEEYLPLESELMRGSYHGLDVIFEPIGIADLEGKVKIIYGTKPKQKNEVSISNYFYNIFKSLGYYNLSNRTVEEITNYSDLIGKEININNDFLYICGVFESNNFVDAFKAGKKKQLSLISEVSNISSETMTLFDEFVNYYSHSYESLLYVKEEYIESNSFIISSDKNKYSMGIVDIKDKDKLFEHIVIPARNYISNIKNGENIVISDEYNYLVNEMYLLSNSYNKIIIIFVVAFLLFFCFLSLVLIQLTKNIIQHKKKTIKLFVSLGISRNKIEKIIRIGLLKITLMPLLVSIILYILFGTIFNSVIKSLFGFNILFINLVSILILTILYVLIIVSSVKYSIYLESKRKESRKYVINNIDD